MRDRRHIQLPENDNAGNVAVSDAANRALLPEAAVISTSTQDHDSSHRVGWADLPHKSQLAIVTFARMCEPLVQTSLRSYMFYQLKWFDQSLPAGVIAKQAGLLFASFTAAQLFTVVAWSRLADSKRGGRKRVLLVGLLGTSLSCLGSGFATTFRQALLFRTIGGCLNGNVAVMRTVISEVVTDRKYQSRAFLLLPMASSVGGIIGPMLGGLLADPATKHTSNFGSGSIFMRYPYAAANIANAVLLLLATIFVWLGLEETLHSMYDASSNPGSISCHWRTERFRKQTRRERHAGYTGIPRTNSSFATNYGTLNHSPTSEHATPQTQSGNGYTRTLPFKRIFTRNLALTMLAQFLLLFHVGTFNSLWSIFLSTPVWDPKNFPHRMQLPFQFTGGIGLSPHSVGSAMTILGTIGIVLQVLLYPPLSARLGTLLAWRSFLVLFPLAYFAMPFLAIVPSTSEPPQGKTGAGIWTSLIMVQFAHVLALTLTLPSGFILTNNCSPHPGVLATVHGIGHCISCLARTIGPIVGGVVYGLGLSIGYVGLGFWMLSCVAALACVASLFVKDGDGHEIWLEGDQED